MHIYEWVMAHIWMSHGTHRNESCTHRNASCTHTNESWHTYEWVKAHIWMSHGTHTNESWHTYEWVMAHIRMSHGAHTNESWHTHEVSWVCALVRSWSESFTNESWHKYEWVISHTWMSHVSYHHTSPYSLLEWVVYERVMTNIWMRHVKHTNESCLTYGWVTSHVFVRVRSWSGSFTNESWHTFECVMSNIWMSPVSKRKVRACSFLERKFRDEGLGFESHQVEIRPKFSKQILNRQPATKSVMETDYRDACWEVSLSCVFSTSIAWFRACVGRRVPLARTCSHHDATLGR